ncbi:MAG TPA: metallophosphoesterase family protein [Bellilinea sp.]|nr:metallophosphoesterase family protein [Bellilinea sp.]
MRNLIISDIHSNLTALEAVLYAAGEVDEVWCLGDVVGYGADPNECIERLRQLPNLTCLLGNHDAAVLGVLDKETFNGDARAAIDWTIDRITKENLDFLASLEPLLVKDEVTLVHGSPRDPLWEYLLDPRTVRMNLPEISTVFCFHGHSHFPVCFHTDLNKKAEWHVITDGERIELKPIAFANPGSVGQPRDRDNRAAAAIYDTVDHTWLSLRVKYDIEQAGNRIVAAGLPPRLASRLGEGW